MGLRNRRVASTSMNRESSRSHAVFTMTIESKGSINEVVNIRMSQLNLVDLAGSERQKDTHTEGSRLKVMLHARMLSHLRTTFMIFVVANSCCLYCFSFRRPAVSTAPSCALVRWSWHWWTCPMGKTATSATGILNSPSCYGWVSVDAKYIFLFLFFQCCLYIC